MWTIGGLVDVYPKPGLTILKLSILSNLFTAQQLLYSVLLLEAIETSGTRVYPIPVSERTILSS